jgi:hypothetical protein
MPKTAPQFFRFKSKEIASRRRQNKSGPQLVTSQTGQPFAFRSAARDKPKRPSISGPYKKRTQSLDPVLLQPVVETPEVGAKKLPEKSGSAWNGVKTTGRITDLAITSAKIILAGLCGSALICTIRD